VPVDDVSWFVVPVDDVRPVVVPVLPVAGPVEVEVVVVAVVSVVAAVVVVSTEPVVEGVVVVDALSLEATTARATPRPMTAASSTAIASFTPVPMPLAGGVLPGERSRMTLVGSSFTLWRV
jgi:hypothetical protein